MDPIIPELARDLATEVGTAALLASAFAFPCALGQPILGAMGDAVGKARMIKICLTLLAIGSAASALAPTIEILFAARVLTGLASGGIIPLCFATVGDRFAMKDRQVALSRVLSAILIGQLGGAIGSGLIATYSSWRVVLACAHDTFLKQTSPQLTDFLGLRRNDIRCHLLESRIFEVRQGSMCRSQRAGVMRDHLE